jgi:hypothetical protein
MELFFSFFKVLFLLFTSYYSVQSGFVLLLFIFCLLTECTLYLWAHSVYKCRYRNIQFKRKWNNMTHHFTFNLFGGLGRQLLRADIELSQLQNLQ